MISVPLSSSNILKVLRKESLLNCIFTVSAIKTLLKNNAALS